MKDNSDILDEFKKLNNFKVRLILYILISFYISSYLVQISNFEKSWYEFWEYFRIPTMWPAFIDLDHVRDSLICKMNGINPFLSNPCDNLKVRYQYPPAWLHIFEYLNLDNINNFKIFIKITIFIYLFFCLYLMELTKKKFNLLIIFILFFSTSFTLLIERGNVDYLIFILLFSSIFFNNYYYKSTIFFLGTILKIYPLFSFFYLIRSKEKIFLTLIIVLVTIYLLYEISLSKYVDKNHSIMALSQSYGVQSITEGIFKTLEKTNVYFFLEKTKNLIRFYSSIFFLIISSLIFYYGTKLKLNYKKKLEDNKKELFILGASIYIGTYIFYSNVDYRLVFLLLTIPFMDNLSPKYNYFYCFMVLIVSFSWVFSFNPLTLNHIVYTSFLYLIKIMIFFFLSMMLGNISKNFFSINRKKIE